MATRQIERANKLKAKLFPTIVPHAGVRVVMGRAADDSMSPEDIKNELKRRRRALVPFGEDILQIGDTAYLVSEYSFTTGKTHLHVQSRPGRRVGDGQERETGWLGASYGSSNTALGRIKLTAWDERDEHGDKTVRFRLMS